MCHVSVGEETVDARSPNFAFLSLMNAGALGPTLARGGKLTLARCVWYPGPGLMEKACFHSCQSHLLRATPRLHTHGKTTTSSSLTLLSPARHRDSLFLLSSGPVWEEIMSKIIQIIHGCAFLLLHCDAFGYYLQQLSYKPV